MTLQLASTNSNPANESTLSLHERETWRVVPSHRVQSGRAAPLANGGMRESTPRRGRWGAASHREAVPVGR
jgi:hypothetical protein